MDRMDRLRIKPISKSHKRNNFCCNKATLNEYLRRYARQHDEKNISKTFVAIDADSRILGYYSLSAANIEFEECPANIRHQLPEYPVPAALITRLAVDSSAGSNGIGARLLIDALQHIVSASDNVAIKVILVDALDEQAKDFYCHFGFLPLPGYERKLFLPIETVLQLF